MFHFVYVLESEKYIRSYVGYYPGNIDERLNKHNSGKVFSTKPYMPWRIIFYEAYLNQQDALRREKYLKTSQGMKMLKFMLREYRKSKNRILLPGSLVG
ncbi:MAG: GIY-YIG nuclease family protein [Candidatus Doudnabacteria bacterium]